MASKHGDKWCRSLAGKSVRSYKLTRFVGAGRIGYVYEARLEGLPDRPWAVKLVFGSPRQGWEVELRKVMALASVQGVVHFHGLDTDQITQDGLTDLCQFTVWDYISPGENLRSYLQRVDRIPTSFLLAVVERILHVLYACDALGVPRHGDLHSGNILIGDESGAILDDSLQKRVPIYVSDFGYGTTGGAVSLKDDYLGLVEIINEMLKRVDRSRATGTHRQILQSIHRDLGRLLKERDPAERRKPLELLKFLREIQQGAQAAIGDRSVQSETRSASDSRLRLDGSHSVGQFQVSEMIGERWDWWQRLFVPTVPARSKILALDIPTVVTGPRGCGKTMLFRRLSERLIVECGDVPELAIADTFMALYVNANDFADAFARFPAQPSESDEARLVCYANLCVLADLLAVQSARAGRLGDGATDSLMNLVQGWLVPKAQGLIAVGEDRLERCRDILEDIKWSFPNPKPASRFPGYDELCQARWLPRFFELIGPRCPWVGARAPLLFIDDFSTPRVSKPMQRVLNRLFLQRSHRFLAKVATEAWTTFVPEDSSGKQLQDGDDYQLVDMGEESLFLSNRERLAFLKEVFARRLAVDERIPDGYASLPSLLGKLGLSKTEFARRLRMSLQNQTPEQRTAVGGASQRRGASRARVLYHGEEVFSDLWSGDTRTMIQLLSDVIDQAFEPGKAGLEAGRISLPVDPEIQDRAFRNRGGEWLNSHTRNEPTNPPDVRSGLEELARAQPDYRLAGGSYGDHLKAIVEAFVFAATRLLMGPTYVIKEPNGLREVPRMAFRIEITDEFRVDGLAAEIYRDLIRYGLFMRDSRGKSVQGAFVPRLYLRRLLLPYCTLALSKRDSVSLGRSDFLMLLLEPDNFRKAFVMRLPHPGQMEMFGGVEMAEADPAYDDLRDYEAGSSERTGLAEGLSESEGDE